MPTRINSKTFEIIFKEYYPKLVAFACKRVNDLETSEDLVQELFTKLVQSDVILNKGDALKSYLFSAVNNLCKNHYRRNSIEARYLDSLREEDFTVDRLEMEQIEFEYQIFRIIRTLPPKCRRIFTMNRFEGQSNADIARTLGISKRTVETQISKALKILREKLTREGLNYFNMILGLGL